MLLILIIYTMIVLITYTYNDNIINIYAIIILITYTCNDNIINANHGVYK